MCILMAALSAPQIPPITEPQQATTELPVGAIKPNATVSLVVGTDSKSRNITGTVRYLTIFHYLLYTLKYKLFIFI